MSRWRLICEVDALDTKVDALNGKLGVLEAKLDTLINLMMARER